MSTHPEQPIVQAASRVDPPALSVFSVFDPALHVDPKWALVEEGFQLAREHELESIFTVANGYVGTRGSLAEGTSLSAPATFLAGHFETGSESPASLELVTLPDWTQFHIMVEERPLSMEAGTIIAHRRVLDLLQGLFLRQWRHEDISGRVTDLMFLRLVSMHDRHLFLQSAVITPVNYTGTVSLVSSVQVPRGRMPWSTRPEGEICIEIGRPHHGGPIVMAHRADVVFMPTGQPVKRILDDRDGRAIERWTWKAAINESARFDRMVATYSGRDVQEPVSVAHRRVRQARESGVGTAIRLHCRAWVSRSRVTDVLVEGDDAAQRALRFAVYHLNSGVNPHDEQVSIGARALSGSTYKGHVFWDTEIYVLPFYIFTDPPAARSLLMYRFHRLAAARERARKLGYRGALYPWESADSGEDVTPDSVIGPDGRVIQVLTGLQEHHISADIAYAVWQYWEATGDEDFFASAGTEMLIETARFWATRGRVETDGRYHIRTVIGPDEYHEAVDDNAYTNVMAQWNLRRAADAVDWLRAQRPDAWERLSTRLEVAIDEAAAWRRLADVVYTGHDARTGLFEQFAGYFLLEDLDLDAYRARTVPIDIILGRERTQRSKVVKQADVVALSALLWDAFPPSVHEANFRYYEPRTAHGSSLSPAFHALVAARLGDGALALRYFHEAASIDLSNHMGNAAGGIHIATLGGLWQAAVFGMAGVRIRDNGFVIDPHLPPGWKQLSFRLQWRGQLVAFTLGHEPDHVTVRLHAGDSMTIDLNGGSAIELRADDPYVARHDGLRWTDWQQAPKSPA